MNRAQASVEYVLLCAALILVTCLLVRFESPVSAIAHSLEAALTGHPSAKHPHRGHPGHHRRPTHRVCWCAAPGDAE